ncbi:histidine phosphotransferase [Fimicolochytrium jonesii]|uniref:histidine phosphotransferase n=1 Tax=Fimicolochytrium jonesii TaxID=1396493 RepID=UPI0022FDFF0F|nr:histidine phosphotransferase [Fimicolochytrium jonesii]KAI8820472.1 histidine phosphotransferase [Fimicolochytrium jonesii]
MPSDEIVDHNIFDQLLEMDEDDEDRSFSRDIVTNYFEQAETTFASMDTSLKEKDLPALSRLGHFLKGSSAALGLTKVKASCEKMQHYGNMKDEHGSGSITEEDALKRITALLKQTKTEYKEAEDYLKKFYETDGDAAAEDEE